MGDPEILVARNALDAADAALQARMLVGHDDPRAEVLDAAVDALGAVAKTSLDRARERSSMTDPYPDTSDDPEIVECPHCGEANHRPAVEHQGVCWNCREEIPL